MKHKHVVPGVVAMVAMGILGISRIASAQDAPKSGNIGDATTVGATATATVKAVDPQKRIVTLQTADGDIVDIKCGKQVENFDQIKVGDQVKAVAIDRIVVSLGKGAAPSGEAATLIARAPKGGQPGVVIANTEEVTAKVDAVDADKQTVTLSGLEKKPETVRVASDVDLANVKKGDDLTVRVTEGVAFWVAGPAEAQPAAGRAQPEGAAGGLALEGGATATVAAVDANNRTVKLKFADGTTRTIHLGKESVNFGQIKVGDKVRATVAEEVAVSIGKSGAAPSSAHDQFVALAPKGGMPGMIVADTEEVTAKIKSVDAQKGTITLTEPDGATRTVKAGQHVRISELKEGEDVTARITQAEAIVVQKPS